MESLADKYNQNNSVGTADVKMSNNERPGKTNPVLERTWWGNIAKCFLNCWRWRKGMMKQPVGCTCD